MGGIQETHGDRCQSRAGEGLMRYLFRRTAGSDSTNRKIFRAAVIIGFSTLLVKVGTALKEVLVARLFGRSDVLDAFLIAYLVPYFVMSLAMGALVSAFVPTFVETREKQGADAAQRLFSSVMFLSIVVVIPVTILLAVLAPYYLPYMGSNFSAAKLRLTRELLYVLLPFVLFGGVAAFVSAVLNVGEKFALPALTPLVTPVVTILFLAAAAKSWGAFSLAGGIVTGSILEAALLTRSLYTRCPRTICTYDGWVFPHVRYQCCRPVHGGDVARGKRGGLELRQQDCWGGGGDRVNRLEHGCVALLLQDGRPE